MLSYLLVHITIRASRNNHFSLITCYADEYLRTVYLINEGSLMTADLTLDWLPKNSAGHPVATPRTASFLCVGFGVTDPCYLQRFGGIAGNLRRQHLAEQGHEGDRVLVGCCSVSGLRASLARMSRSGRSLGVQRKPSALYLARSSSTKAWLPVRSVIWRRDVDLISG